MKLNKTNFIKTINKISVFEKNPTVAVGVSGGPDSMALIDLVNKWSKVIKGKITAVIVDHNLRSNSSEETNLILNHLLMNGINTKLLTVNKNKIKNRSMNEARINRYNLIIDYCKKNKIMHLLIGHHFDDNIETFVNRRIAGSDFEGLQSIKSISLTNKIIIIRPLLYFKKKEIYEFNKKNNIFYFEDPTNINTNYTRPAIRKFLREVNIKTYSNIQNEFQIIQDNLVPFNLMINEILIRNLIEVNSKYLKINYNKLIKLDNLLLEHIIKKAYQFFNNKNKFLRSKKIQYFIKIMVLSNFKIYNLGGMMLKKVDNSLVFSKKTN
tara:strand:- start:173 stop:1144 length:972 start_codon:yes stop_codon:yes gene_type:complete